MLNPLPTQSPKPQILIVALGVLGFGLGLALSSTYSEEAALQDDAASYWRVAEELRGGAPLLALSGPLRFVDVGYPLVLAIASGLFGTTVRVGQIANVMMFGIASVFHLLAVRKLLDNLETPLRSRRQFLVAGAFFLSPLFLTFSGKLYSEISAAMGLEILLCSILHLWSPRGSKSAPLSRFFWSSALVIGSFLFVVTKSAFFPLLILYVIAFIILRKRRLAMLTAVGLLICTPFYLSAQRGGRGIYSFATQVAKLQWSYSEIAASALYNYSDTLGKTLLPSYTRLLQQNPRSKDDADPRNAYMLAEREREQGFSYPEGFRRIADDPIKYFLLALATLPAMVAAEGLYPAVSGTLPYPLVVFLWITLKQVLSLTLWAGFVKLLIRHRRIPLVHVLALPIFYFTVVYANFSMEQRWFFPLLPLLWLFGSSYFSAMLGGKRTRAELVRAFNEQDPHDRIQ